MLSMILKIVLLMTKYDTSILSNLMMYINCMWLNMNISLISLKVSKAMEDNCVTIKYTLLGGEGVGMAARPSHWLTNTLPPMLLFIFQLQLLDPSQVGLALKLLRKLSVCMAEYVLAYFCSHHKSGVCSFLFNYSTYVAACLCILTLFVSLVCF